MNSITASTSNQQGYNDSPSHVQNEPILAGFTSKEWSTGLCGCCSVQEHCCNSCGFCFAACMFPCCAQGALLKDTGLVDDCYGASCIFCCCYTVPIVPYAVFCNLRQNIAEARGIKETFIETFCQVLCCFPCAMTQVYNDLVAQNYKFNRNSGMLDSFVGNVTHKAAYVANYGVASQTVNSMSP
jgi:hypothetical protein